MTPASKAGIEYKTVHTSVITPHVGHLQEGWRRDLKAAGVRGEAYRNLLKYGRNCPTKGLLLPGRFARSPDDSGLHFDRR